MDATAFQIRQSGGQLRIALAVFALFCCHRVNEVRAQSIELISSAKSVAAKHTLADNHVDFPASRWQVVNDTIANGCVIVWDATAFQHQSLPKVRANCEIRARIVDGNRSARWQLERSADISAVEDGRENATVILSSRSTGFAEIAISVRYQDVPGQRPVAGAYSTTVTGTITGR